MKQLLLITAISCACVGTVFAGSSCKTCPTAPAQNPTEKNSDADTIKKDDDTDSLKELLAANDTPGSMTPADEKNACPTMPAPADSTIQTDGQVQTKFLLAGGSAPSATDANKPVAPTDEQKTETEADKAAQPQLIA